MANEYKPANSQLVYGSHAVAKQLEIEAEKQRRAQSAVQPTPSSNAQMEQMFGSKPSTFSQNGHYTQDPSKGGTETEYLGEKGWYYVEGTPRQVQEGASGADEQFLSDESYAAVQQLKAEYEAAKAAGDMAAANEAHAKAENIRARAGYSGGADGSWYITNGQLGVSDRTSGYGTGVAANARPGTTYYDDGSNGTGASDPSSDLRDLLSQWQDAAKQQSDGKIDYAVAKAVAELERALEDAQPQFKEQAEAVARDEMQSRDNSALYAEARGDKGGIGKAQYDEIMAAAAQNRLAVQQAQTQLSTDTARQIADLRAQGEFEKADAALEIAQTYLSQLISLEQWAAEYNLSVDQFQESVRQWEAEFDLAMQQFKVDTDLAYGSATGVLPSTGQLTLGGQSQLADMGAAMLEAGIMPNADQLAAMGMTESQAQQYLTALQLEAASKDKGKVGDSTPGSPVDVYQMLFDLGYTNRSEASIKAYLMSQGMTNSEASAYAEAYVSEQYNNLRGTAERESAATTPRPVYGYVTDGTASTEAVASQGLGSKYSEAQAKISGMSDLLEVSDYLKSFTESELTESGLDALMSQSGLYDMGTRFSEIASTAKNMAMRGKSESEISTYLNRFSSKELTSDGFNRIWASLGWS